MRRRSDIDRLQGEIEELFSDLWQVPRLRGLRHGFRPLVDCYRTEDPPTLTVVVELAGIDPAELCIDVGERELVVSGQRPRPREPGRVYQQMEIEYGAFERSVSLAEPVDPDAAAADYRGGMLTITLPVTPRRPTRERVTILVRRDGS